MNVAEQQIIVGDLIVPLVESQHPNLFLVHVLKRYDVPVFLSKRVSFRRVPEEF